MAGGNKPIDDKFRCVSGVKSLVIFWSSLNILNIADLHLIKERCNSK
jgi:hypothetical protein